MGERFYMGRVLRVHCPCYRKICKGVYIMTKDEFIKNAVIAIAAAFAQRYGTYIDDHVDTILFQANRLADRLYSDEEHEEQK